MAEFHYSNEFTNEIMMVEFINGKLIRIQLPICQ